MTAESTKSIKILFWVSPITEMAWPLQKMPWIKTFIPRIKDTFRKIGYDIDSTIIASENIIAESKRQDVNPDGHFLVIPQSDLLGGFRFNALDETIKYLQNHKMTPFFRHLGSVVKKALGNDYHPDVIVSFSSSPFFKEIYPDSLLLYHEYGMLSRKPYPETFYFDPSGVTSRNFSTTHAAQINAIPSEKRFVEELDKYRHAIRNALCSNEFLDKYFRGITSRFRKTLLLPLSLDGFADARINFPYQTQLEYVEHILSIVPEDVAVILTQHPQRALTDDAIASLKTLNANLFHETWYYNVPFLSQIAIPYCDACITQNSSLGYQAIFHKKLFFSVGGFCDGIADAHSIAEIPTALNKTPVERDNFVVWVLRNHVADAEDLPNYLRGLITAWSTRTTAIDTPKDWPISCSFDRFKRRLERWTAMISAPELKGARMKVYFDCGHGFSEANKFSWSVAEGESSFTVDKSIAIPNGCTAIRFDPTENGIVEVANIHLIGDNGEIPLSWQNGLANNGTICFKTVDPQLVFKPLDNSQTFRLVASVKRVDPANAIRSLTSDLASARRNFSEASKKLDERNSQLQAATNLAAQANQTLGAETACIKMLKEIAAEEKSARSVAEKEKSDALQSLDEKAEKLRNAETALADAKAKIRISEFEHDSLVKNLDSLRVETEKLESALSETKVLLDEALQRENAGKANISSLSEKNVTLENNAKDAKVREAKSASEISTLRGQTTNLQRQLQNAKSQNDAARKEVAALKAKTAELRKLLQLANKRAESRLISKRIRRFIRGLIPYGISCAWLRMAYGIAEDVPLMHYHGFFKRTKRIVKFALPFGLVTWFKKTFRRQ